MKKYSVNTKVDPLSAIWQNNITFQRRESTKYYQNSKDNSIRRQSLPEPNHVFNENGFQITSMASDTNGMWEKYVLNWNGKRDLLRLKQDIHNQELKNWIKQWYDMYFDYRRQYEGQAMFGLQRIV